MTPLQSRLFDLQDKPYGEFQSKLIPTLPPERVIGVRTPLLRKLAKEYAGDPEAERFLCSLPHYYYEENNVHGFLIEQMKDYDRVIEELDRFLPYVDNWATCDSVSPKVLKKHTEELLTPIRRWMASDEPYTIRFGIEMLMRLYLDEAFQPDYLEWVAPLRSEEYYVNMMIAWYFATALTKQYEATLPFFRQRRLAVWTHNKSIQKAVESYRVSGEQKAYLKTLRIPK